MHYYYFIVITPIFQLTKPRLGAVGCGADFSPRVRSHSVHRVRGAYPARPGPNARACDGTLCGCRVSAGVLSYGS